MLKIFVLLFCLSFGNFVVSAELVEKKALDGAVSIKLPSNFTRMDKELIKQKYPSEKAPKEVYTDPTGAVNFAFKYSEDKLSDADLPKFREFMVRLIGRQYPKATWHQKDIRKINGKMGLVLELTTQAIDTDVRNLMLVISVKGRLLVVSFNVTKELEKQWLAIGRTSIESIKISATQ